MLSETRSTTLYTQDSDDEHMLCDAGGHHEGDTAVVGDG